MSFNIRGATVQDGDNHWQHRAFLNIATLQKYAPDLIGFQECESLNLDAYQAQLPGYAFYPGPACNRMGRVLFNAIFWNPSRFGVFDAGGFYLSRTPHIWSVGWGSARVRAAAWVKLRCNQSGLAFILFNTHLDHISESARLEGSRLILEKMTRLRAGTLPVIVTGDFNSPPDLLGGSALAYSPYRVFRERGFRDAYLATGHADTQGAYTFHGFQGKKQPVAEGDCSLRLDWILILDGASVVHTTACRIIRDAKPPVYPSDHYPVLAELQFNRQSVS